jgi:hypothetical protein
MILLAIALSAGATDTFHLQDAAGKRLGPFEFAEGKKLQIAGTEYTISKVLTPDERIRERMKSIIIPEIDFRAANIHDVVAFLADTSGREVSIVLNLGSGQTAKPVEDDPFADPFAAEPAPATPDAALLTFRAQQLSLHDALSVVCRLGNLDWAIMHSVVMIEPAK